MGRDSNPRKPCDFSGFQDRRIRPLCHPSETDKADLVYILTTQMSNIFYPSVSSNTIFITILFVNQYCHHEQYNHQLVYLLPSGTPLVIYPYYNLFLRIAQVKTVNPTASITSDNAMPMVKPHDVKKPSCASGWRNCSQKILNTA